MKKIFLILVLSIILPLNVYAAEDAHKYEGNWQEQTDNKYKNVIEIVKFGNGFEVEIQDFGHSGGGSSIERYNGVIKDGQLSISQGPFSMGSLLYDSGSDRISFQGDRYIRKN